MFLWDLAGQADYQLIHQLFLEQTALALVVFDSSNHDELFTGVERWQKALDRVGGSACRKLPARLGSRTGRGEAMNAGEHWHELWATFSVNDHCRPGAFIAEALLYDRLMIPVVPMRRDNLTPEEADAEWARWKANGWEPARLNQLVAILAERGVPIPWTRELQIRWQQAMTADAAPSTSPGVLEVENVRRNGFVMTGSILERLAPRMARTVVAVSQHHSLEELEAATHVRPRNPAAPILPGSLLAVLGCELLVPDDPDKDDFQLLTEAAKVGSDPTYREKRKQLYMWQQQFVGSDRMTDAPSIHAAVEEMQDLVSSLNNATPLQKLWKGLKSVFAFVKVGSTVATPIAPIGARVAGSAAAIGDFVLTQVEPNLPAVSATPVASLLLDVQKRLKLTVTGERRG